MSALETYLDKTANWRSHIGSLSPEALAKLKAAGILPSLGRYIRGLNKGSQKIMSSKGIIDISKDVDNIATKIRKVPVLGNMAVNAVSKGGAYSLGPNVLATFRPTAAMKKVNPFYNNLNAREALLSKEVLKRHEIAESIQSGKKLKNLQVKDPFSALGRMRGYKEAKRLASKGAVYSHMNPSIYGSEAKILSRLPFPNVKNTFSDLRNKNVGWLTRMQLGKKAPEKTEMALIQKLTGNPNIYNSISRQDINKLNKGIR